MHLPKPDHPWHALFAPLPPGATPRRELLVPAEIAASAEGAAVSGWEKITLDLSAGCDGLRAVMVTVDAAGQPVSASDHVMYRSEIGSGADVVTEFRHESVGGRLEPDGTFHGTRWSTVSTQTADGEDLSSHSTPSPPADDDAAAIRALAAELIRRAPSMDISRTLT
ncbi:MAG TPA: hypothetical protein VFJ16_09215 [Longimicrobium sp.]|nr:hypothetical protein [Longimicrobium sp.]